MVATPVGMKCPDCASNAGAAYLRSAPGELALALLGGAGVAIAFCWILPMCLIAGAPYGWFVGEAVLRCGRRKRGRAMQFAAAVSVLLGGAVWIVYTYVRFGGLPHIFVWANLVLGVIVAVSRIREF